MSLITRFLDWLNAYVANTERKRREAYLASSANAFDLERRLRMLNRHDSLPLQRW